MTNNEGMFFDPDCGIPEEEQREIFAQINGITEKNRMAFAAAGGQDSGGGKKRRKEFNAQKSGGMFPLIVNAAAIAVLAGGFIAIYALQGKANSQVREGSKVYNTAERALIDEIRKETSSRLEAKENEIHQIASKLGNIDAELQELYSSNQELTSEQRAAEERLKAMQDEYRAALGNLQNERSRILEEARIREANLQAQLESRTRELALVSEQSAAAIDISLSELDRLNKEQLYAATVESQMAAFFANLSDAVNESRYKEAGETIKAMRAFLNTPTFQGLRSIQARKDLYAQAINSYEAMVEEALRYQAAISGDAIPLDKDTEKMLADLQARASRLEHDIAEKDKSLTALSSGASGASQRLAEMEGSINTLRNANAALESSSAEKDGRINSMTQERASMAQERAALNTTVSRQEATIANRNECLTQIQNIVQGKSISDMTIGELSDSLVRIQQALQTLTP